MDLIIILNGPVVVMDKSNLFTVNLDHTKSIGTLR